MGNKSIGYTISAVAAIYDVHPQTLRSYERHGLLQPSRSEGNTRVYSDDDLIRLEVILNLTRELGVNLAGVEVVLNMRAKMEQMQRDVQELIEYLRTQFDVDPKRFEDRFRHALVPTRPSPPVRVRKREPTRS